MLKFYNAVKMVKQNQNVNENVSFVCIVNVLLNVAVGNK